MKSFDVPNINTTLSEKSIAGGNNRVILQVAEIDTSADYNPQIRNKEFKFATESAEMVTDSLWIILSNYNYILAF
jgi:hypothetical protein